MRIFILLICLVFLAHCSKRPNPVVIPQVVNIYNKTWYSGYLDFAFENYTAHMHYFYFPSQSKSADTDPVLFWFNGGPGCSSLLGALYQHGPFIFNDAFGFLVENPQAWNKRAHTIYIESPAQVGFSYIDIPQGGKYPEWNDDRVAILNLGAVLEFFKVFTELNMKPTFLAGQSYAGIYVPTLAYKIHKYNTEVQNAINLKGFAVGNGCTDLDQCEFINDYPHYQYRLFNDIGILPDVDFSKAEQQCFKGGDLSEECIKQMNKIDHMMHGINIYDAYRPCWENNKNSNGRKMKFSQMLKQVHRTNKKGQNKLKGWAPPCIDSEGIDRLLDNEENRKQMGIANMPPYSMCNPNDDFIYSRSKTGSYWVYQNLVPLNKYKIVKYSGDSDPAVPFSGTIQWVNKLRIELKLSTRKYWKPWDTRTSSGNQNSGSLWEFSNKFSLFRFKGVGHMAPQWNNQGGTKLINYLLFDQQP